MQTKQTIKTKGEKRTKDEASPGSTSDQPVPKSPEYFINGVGVDPIYTVGYINIIFATSSDVWEILSAALALTVSGANCSIMLRFLAVT
ncbi:hypothetical protein DPMN_125056 [Dreissena polymorpha]|uniref:Uncharacterized protein n=1 Tax=Dreissena polymorpha TaxID=45954 RepID=A0A9D4GUP6_DREPO|nr:hypothetical protein DPMN_125056 [Dreissena polymorpha]